jgi:nucleotide-binding universal stress UspA family protein
MTEAFRRNLKMNHIRIVLASPFVSSFSAIFRRSTTVSSRGSQPLVRDQLWPNGRRIIVPVMESVVSMQAVKLACQLAAERQATLMLACVVHVPDSVGLDQRLPGAEERAKRLLRQAEGIVMQHGLQAESCVLHHRRAEDALLELAGALSAEAIVVGMASASWWSSSQIGKMVSDLLQHAPCEVVIAKAPLAA